MIPRSKAIGQNSDWQKSLAASITDPKELLALLELDNSLLEPARLTAKAFPLRVSRSFVARMEKGNMHDPLLRQVLPIGAETAKQPGFKTDPLVEKGATNPVPGILHKYKSRVLLTVSSGCGIHCRYCFRRHFPYEDNNPGSRGWQQALNYIANDFHINEVILSGGDPLIASDKLLQNLITQISEIPHVDTLRIHSRLPIVIPERVTEEFIHILETCRLQKVLVLHCNHPNEMDDTVKTSMQRLREINVTLLNQGVLLKGVNDSAETLIALSKKLFEAGILPYYLHLLDKVKGAAHFDVNVKTARDLMQAIMKALPGYLVPKLVREQNNMPAKVPIFVSLKN